MPRSRERQPRKKHVAAVMVAPAKRSQNAPAPKSSVSEECLFRPDGQRERILTLDANSATFATDLTLVFEKNVARARSEHKKKFGSADRVDPKA
jgi:hypothetical protein